MTDIWSGRAQAYRESAIHSRGEDLDLVVEWCEPGEGVTALDVATGGGSRRAEPGSAAGAPGNRVRHAAAFASSTARRAPSSIVASG